MNCNRSGKQTIVFSVDKFMGSTKFFDSKSQSSKQADKLRISELSWVFEELLDSLLLFAHSKHSELNVTTL